MKVEEIKVINVKGVAHAVETMSENVQRLVSVLNDWRQDEVDARNKLMMVQAAQRELSREIIAVVEAEEVEKAKVEPVVVSEAPVVPADTTI